MFTLDESEKKKLESWLDKKDLSRYTGAIGGRFTYSFTNTNLGQIVKVTDNLDGTEIDLTDYESW